MSIEKPLRVIHIITTLSTGGAEAMLFKLLKQTNQPHVIEQQVVSLSGLGHFGPMLRRMGIDVTCLSLKHFPLNLVRLFQLCLAMQRRKPDLLMSWLYHADFVGVFLARICGVPKIIWNLRCSNMDLSQYHRLTYFIFRILAKMSRIPDAVIVNSQSGMAYHQENGYHPRRFVMIPNGFDTHLFKPNDRARTKFRKKNCIEAFTQVIGMVARFDPMKDHALFFKAAGIIDRAMRDVRFILVGQGLDESNPSIQKMIDQNQLNGKIILLGVRSDLNDIYPAFDLLVSTSAFGEGFPNVIGEAMSCGLPIVATDVGAVAQLIGGCGRIISPGKANDMAQACIDLLSLSEAEKKRIGRAARARMITHFDIERIGRLYIDFIFDVNSKR